MTDHPADPRGPRTPGLGDFVADLARSELVDPLVVSRALADLAPDPAEDASVRLARMLVRSGALTPYQARKVLAGATQGFLLGGYRILRPIGEGGMGKVFLAIHVADGRRVAIKVLPPKKALSDDQALDRFRREMDLSRRVLHPNLARTLEVGSEGDIHFMVMEYVAGESLYRRVKGGRGPLRVADAARYFLQVLDGLGAAHDGGLIHRDIKPSNLMVTPDGGAVLLDLGLAHASDEAGVPTPPDVVIGTLDYASPEQIGDAARADPRSDLYSLGCTLYFALTGRPPFEGGDLVNKIYKHRMEEPEPLERLARGVPAAFAAVVRKLMSKDPEDRHQSCDELRVDLARWTDPREVLGALGAEAESSRPPPADLERDDLRLVTDGDDPDALTYALRDLGDAEPDIAPDRPPAPESAPPRSHVGVSRKMRGRPAIPPPGPTPPEGSSWLFRFILVVVGLGLLAILMISIFR